MKGFRALKRKQKRAAFFLLASMVVSFFTVRILKILMLVKDLQNLHMEMPEEVLRLLYPMPENISA